MFSCTWYIFILISFIGVNLICSEIFNEDIKNYLGYSLLRFNLYSLLICFKNLKLVFNCLCYNMNVDERVWLCVHESMCVEIRKYVCICVMLNFCVSRLFEF